MRRGRRPPAGQGLTYISVARRTLVRFEELCRMYLELERLGGLPIPQLPKYNIDPGRGVFREAERIADLARTQLGLGPTSRVEMTSEELVRFDQVKSERGVQRLGAGETEGFNRAPSREDYEGRA